MGSLRKVAVAAILAPVIGIAGLWVTIQMNDREHGSRQADRAIEDYDALKASVRRWVGTTKDVYWDSYRAYEQTGRWRRGTDSEAYQAVYRAGTEVRDRQDSIDDRILGSILDALRGDIQGVCTATSRRSADAAADEMIKHWRAVNRRIKTLRDPLVRQLGMVMESHRR